MEQTASSEDILLSFDEESLFMKLPVKAARNQTTTGTTWRPKWFDRFSKIVFNNNLFPLEATVKDKIYSTTPELTAKK